MKTNNRHKKKKNHIRYSCIGDRYCTHQYRECESSHLDAEGRYADGKELSSHQCG